MSITSTALLTRATRLRRRTPPKGTDAGIFTCLSLTLLALFAILPIILFFFTSAKTSNDSAASPLGLPKTWEWGNFLDAWIQGNIGAGLITSAVVVAGTAALTLVVSGWAAYALARLDIKVNRLFINFLLISSSLPTQMFLVPL